MAGTVRRRGRSVVIRPSRFVRATMGPMTKVLNPTIMKLAGRPHFRLPR